VVKFNALDKNEFKSILGKKDFLLDALSFAGGRSLFHRGTKLN
jgi:hypothetical protein